MDPIQIDAAFNGSNQGADALRKKIIQDVRVAGDGASRQAASSSAGATPPQAGRNSITMPGVLGRTLRLFIFNYDKFNDPNTYFGAEPLEEDS